MLGQDVTNQIYIQNMNETKVIIDISQLATGFYVVNTNTKTTKININRN